MFDQLMTIDSVLITFVSCSKIPVLHAFRVACDRYFITCFQKKKKAVYVPVVSWSAELVSLLIQPEDIACDGNFLFSTVGQVLFQHNPERNLFKLPA